MRALLSMTEPPFAHLGEAPDPTPEPNQALVEVRAFSLNRGETKRLATMEPGSARVTRLAGRA